MFDADDLDGLLSGPGSASAAITLHGVPVRTVRGIFRQRTEARSPYLAEETAIVPALRCKSGEVADIGRSHVLTINGAYYRIFGDPEPHDSGTTLLYLVKA